MASRVNIRFVAILVTVLLLLAGGVVIAAWYALKKTGEQHAAMGDQRMKEADYEKAAEHYAKAVNKNQGNAEWTAKWIDALQQTTPTPRQAYIDRFVTDYAMALHGLSNSSPTSVAAQRPLLDGRYRQIRLMAPRDLAAWESLVVQVNDILERFRENPDAGAPLRRYRGLARMAIFGIIGISQRPKEEPAEAQADLAAASTADKTDEESSVALATWYVLSASQSRAANEDAAAAQAIQKARALLQGSARDNAPAGSRSWLGLLQVEMNEALRAAPPKTSYADLLASQGELVDHLLGAIKAEPAEKLDAPTVVQACATISASPKVGPAGVISLLQECIDRRPADPVLLLALGRNLLGQNKIADALAAFQKVVDLPDPKLSLEGIQLLSLRAEAMRWQVQAKLAEWETTKGAAERAAQLKLAEGYRNTLAAYVGENENIVWFIDAKLDVARGDVVGARTKLDRYNQLTNNSDSEAVLILADLMGREGNIGAARDLYLKLIARDRSNTRLLSMLGNLEFRQGNYKEAADRFAEVLKINPDDASARDRFKTLNDLVLGKDSPDPVMRALSRAQELSSGVSPDYSAASAVIREAMSAGTDDTRLYMTLARLRMLDDDTAGAKRVIDEGLAKHPDEQRLKDYQKAMSTEDPVAAITTVIEASEASDFNKKMLLFLAFQRAGKPDLAKQALAKAAEIDSGNPAVIEYQFQVALGEKDLESARRIAETAATKNTDHAQGAWFRARLDIAENKLESGATALEQLGQSDKLNVDLWRLLGNTRLAMSQPKQAAEAFTKALDLRPGDVPSIVGMLRSKGLLRDYDQALALARQKETVAAADPDFVDVWLSLESIAAGGDKARALEVRRQLARRDPENERNNLAFAGLLMESKRWDEARAIIDSLMARRSDAANVELLAQWHVAQGDMQGARAAVDRYAATLPADRPSDGPYISLGAMLMNFRHYSAAMEVMDEARKRQDKKEMSADRNLGDFLYAIDRFADARTAYQRVLDGGAPDPGNLVAKRIIECELRLARFEEARKRLDAMGATVDADAVLMRMKAELLAATGNRPAARELFDRAIAAAKADPQGYIKRADFLSREIDTLADAESDLRQAIILDPRSIAARQRLASLCATAGRWSDSIATLRDGLTLDPDNDALRLMLVALHLDRREVDEAVSVIEQALQRRPNDLDWLRHGARVTATEGRWSQTVKYGERIWQLSHTPDHAMLYVDSLLRVEPAETAKAAAVLEAPELKIPESLPLLLTRSRVLFRLNRTTEASKDALAALALAKDDPSLVDTFFSGMEVLFPDPSRRFKAILELNPPDGFVGWRAVFLAGLKAAAPDTKDQGISELKQIAESGQTPEMRRFAYAQLGTYAHVAKNTEEALAYWRKGLELFPDDAELNNNVGYVLTARLNRPAEARPFA